MHDVPDTIIRTLMCRYQATPAGIPAVSGQAATTGVAVPSLALCGSPQSQVIRTAAIAASDWVG